MTSFPALPASTLCSPTRALRDLTSSHTHSRPAPDVASQAPFQVLHKQARDKEPHSPLEGRMPHGGLASSTGAGLRVGGEVPWAAPEPTHISQGSRGDWQAPPPPLEGEPSRASLDNNSQIPTQASGRRPRLLPSVALLQPWAGAGRLQDIAPGEERPKGRGLFRLGKRQGRGGTREGS